MDISIHALREEGDYDVRQLNAVDFEFLSTPSARRATKSGNLWQKVFKFLSTPSARRATQSELLYPTASRDFYPRPPRGGRRERPPDRRGLSHFYPRPPRGGRLEPVFMRGMCETFLSTPSARRATPKPLAPLHPVGFLSTPSARRATVYVDVAEAFDTVFLSTPSARRATPLIGC